MLETLDLFGHDRSNEPPPIVKNSCKIEYEKTIEPASKRPKVDLELSLGFFLGQDVGKIPGPYSFKSPKTHHIGSSHSIDTIPLDFNNGQSK
ncbi:hypothetical protein PGT21_005648 [Puccinia graminis f. sp. tritici]|uniref:Uncharacterized protein n=1 Tax=Puccinia graminis f. sp. tritici TaxID=56615 RepID=A0A5B0MEZ2_PUCGR|nr:hypothetical protein PGT21_005648 [Puccinia graminis f. sp. tritici]